MTATTIATPASAARTSPTRSARQRGLSLIEVLVGLSIGLIVIAAATSALMVSRGISGTVSDVSSLQQQAAYAFRVMGQQLRQAGSLYLNPNPTGKFDPTDPQVEVAFETKADATGSGNSFDPSKDTLSNNTSTGAVTIGYRRYLDPVFTASSPQSLARNCVGGPADSSLDQRMESTFRLNGSELQCGGNGTAAQPIVQNVAQFQVRYLLQDTTAPGDTKIQYVTTVAAGQWGRVQGVEVCLVLYGSETMANMPAGSSYTDCTGQSTDMTTLSGDRAKRLHMAFRSVYQLRSQGLL
ncbi:MAG: PilW family protein [Comamonadaceae bacterium]|nr:PilW family protein [Comamonadaceae bacterium]